MIKKGLNPPNIVVLNEMHPAYLQFSNPKSSLATCVEKVACSSAGITLNKVDHFVGASQQQDTGQQIVGGVLKGFLPNLQIKGPLSVAQLELA